MLPAIMDITPITASAWNYPGSGFTSHIPEPAISGRMPTGEQAGPGGTPPKALNLFFRIQARNTRAAMAKNFNFEDRLILKFCSTAHGKHRPALFSAIAKEAISSMIAMALTH